MSEQPKVLGKLSPEHIARVLENRERMKVIQRTVDSAMASLLRSARDMQQEVFKSSHETWSAIYAAHGIDKKTSVHLDEETGEISLCEHNHGLMVVGLDEEAGGGPPTSH